MRLTPRLSGAPRVAGVRHARPGGAGRCALRARRARRAVALDRARCRGRARWSRLALAAAPPGAPEDDTPRADGRQRAGLLGDRGAGGSAARASGRSRRCGWRPREPSRDIDSLTFHLPNIGRWIQSGSIWRIDQFVPLQANGNYPHNGDLVFLSVVAAVRAPTRSCAWSTCRSCRGRARRLRDRARAARAAGDRRAGRRLLFAALPVVLAAPRYDGRQDRPDLAAPRSGRRAVRRCATCGWADVRPVLAGAGPRARVRDQVVRRDRGRPSSSSAGRGSRCARGRGASAVLRGGGCCWRPDRAVRRLLAAAQRDRVGQPAVPGSAAAGLGHAARLSCASASATRIADYLDRPRRPGRLHLSGLPGQLRRRRGAARWSLGRRLAAAARAAAQARASRRVLAPARARSVGAGSRRLLDHPVHGARPRGRADPSWARTRAGWCPRCCWPRAAGRAGPIGRAGRAGSRRGCWC